jgi:hypothetical protein
MKEDNEKLQKNAKHMAKKCQNFMNHKEIEIC